MSAQEYIPNTVPVDWGCKGGCKLATMPKLVLCCRKECSLPAVTRQEHWLKRALNVSAFSRRLFKGTAKKRHRESAKEELQQNMPMHRRARNGRMLPLTYAENK